MSKELVAGIGSGENTDHMLPPTYPQNKLTYNLEDYGKKESITLEAIRPANKR